jgi:hypothetical protein
MKRSLVAFLVAFVSASAAITAQRPADATPPAGAAALPIPQPAPGFVQPKTPWGDPDLQGFWPGVEMVGVPLQRPARFGTRNVLTDAEFTQRGKDIKEEEESLVAEIDVFTAEINPNCAIRCPTSPMPYWQETGKASRQASLIIDPADGRQPPLSPEGQKRQAEQQAEARARRDRLQGREADTYLDRSLYDRCITRGVMGSLLPTIYNNGNEIVQGPGYVVIRNEMIHEARVIPLDGRPHVGAGVRAHMGDPRGRWDGNSLVVETTNFTSASAYRNANPDTFRVIERFTRVAPDRIEWTATLDDPKTYTRPWSTAIRLIAVPDTEMLDAQCLENEKDVPHLLNAKPEGAR